MSQTIFNFNPLFLLSFYKYVSRRRISILSLLLLATTAFALRINVKGGGYGGNEGSLGRLTYDGLDGNLPFLSIERDTITETCYLQNNDAVVLDYHSEITNPKYSQFPCVATNPEHNNVYWNGNLRSVCGAYSQGNDALFAATVVKNMYLDWYGVLPIKFRDGSPLVMAVNAAVDDVHIDRTSFRTYFGNGKLHPNGQCSDRNYPYVSLKIVAHEMAHGFTAQHANFAFDNTEGRALGESFSDMAAITVEYYHSGKISWSLGDEITRNKMPMRSMNDSIPVGKSNYYFRDEHDAASVFNNVFYLIATQKDWNPKKAFDIMIYANMFFWNEFTNFAGAACGVFHAAACLKYDINVAAQALSAVDLPVNTCTRPSVCPQRLFKEKQKQPEKPQVVRESWLRYTRG